MLSTLVVMNRLCLCFPRKDLVLTIGFVNLAVDLFLKYEDKLERSF